jgi:hypothetical protein
MARRVSGTVTGSMADTNSIADQPELTQAERIANRRARIEANRQSHKSKGNLDGRSSAGTGNGPSSHLKRSMMALQEEGEEPRISVKQVQQSLKVIEEAKVIL